MMTSKMGVGLGSNGVGAVEAGLIATTDSCVAVSVGEGPTDGKLYEVHAVQIRTMERKIIDFVVIPR